MLRIRMRIVEDYKPPSDATHDRAGTRRACSLSMVFMNTKSVAPGIAVLAAFALVVRVQAQSSQGTTVEASSRCGAATTVDVTSVAHGREAQAAPGPTRTAAGERGLGQTPANDEGGSWYGWQTLSADALSIGLMWLGGSLESPATIVAGFASLNLTSPLIHFIHGRSGAGWLSGGVRLASTALVAGGGALVMEDAFDETDNQRDSPAEVAGAVMGVIGMLGMLTMITVDASLAIEKDARSDRPAAHLQLIPWTTHGSHGATMQVSLQM
jgi:hypothetical protein